MVQTETLFVLGAGAHYPYGMPLGSELARQIIKELPPKLPPFNPHGRPKLDKFSQICTQIYSGNVPLLSRGPHNLLPQMVEFRNRLEQAGQPSIDDFLRTYHDAPGFPEIGRLAIAYLLMKTEFRHDFGRSNTKATGDWLTELFNLMHRGTNGTVEDFLEQNNVSFVTFNYDRTIEHFFYLKLLHTYNLTPESALEALKQIEIKHVYGSLGPYDPNKRNKTDFVNADYKQAADGIQLMFDVRQKETDEILRAQRLYFDHPKKQIFLGFAFDEQNIKTLRLNRMNSEMALYATRYEMTESAWQHVMNSMKPATFNVMTPRPEWDCLSFIQNVYLN